MQAIFLFMIFDVMLIEFNAVCNFGYADAFVSGVHCGKLLVAHFDGAETKTVVCNFFVVSAVCATCHKIGDNSCVGVAFVEAFFEITEFFAVPVNAV